MKVLSLIVISIPLVLGLHIKRADEDVITKTTTGNTFWYQLFGTPSSTTQQVVVETSGNNVDQTTDSTFWYQIYGTPSNIQTTTATIASSSTSSKPWYQGLFGAGRTTLGQSTATSSTSSVEIRTTTSSRNPITSHDWYGTGSPSIPSTTTTARGISSTGSSYSSVSLTSGFNLLNWLGISQTITTSSSIIDSSSSTNVVLSLFTNTRSSSLETDDLISSQTESGDEDEESSSTETTNSESTSSEDSWLNSLLGNSTRSNTSSSTSSSSTRKNVTSSISTNSNDNWLASLLGLNATATEGGLFRNSSTLITSTTTKSSISNTTTTTSGNGFLGNLLNSLTSSISTNNNNGDTSVQSTTVAAESITRDYSTYTGMITGYPSHTGSYNNGIKLQNSMIHLILINLFLGIVVII